LIVDVADPLALLTSKDARVVGAAIPGTDLVHPGLHVLQGELLVQNGYSLPAVDGKTSTNLFGELRADRYEHLLASSPNVNGEIAQAVFVNGNTNYYHFAAYSLASFTFMASFPKAPRPSLTMAQDVPANAAGLTSRLLKHFSNGRDVDVTKLSPGKYVLRDVILPTKPRPPIAVSVSRRIVLPLVLRERGVTDLLSQLGPLRLFVRRHNARNGRYLVNQAEVEAWLLARGYTSIDPGSMVMEEQILLFARATHIVCVEGAAIANVQFSVSAITFVLIASPLVASENFIAPLTEEYGIHLHVVSGELCLSEGTVTREADFALPLDRLRALEAAL